MENRASNLQGARQLQWVFSRARVALALVLVKIRPSGVSAREHAEALASSLKSLDEGWKKEARELQREVLRLRQELLMSRAAAAVASSGEAAGPEDTVDPASQDLFGPECVVHSTSETPELQPSVPSQRSADTPRPQEHPQETLPHAGFLQALCALHRVREGHSGLEALWLGPDGEAGPLLEDAVCQLLAWLVKACKDPPPLGPGDPGLQACRAVAQATDLLCSRRPPSAEFRRRVEASLEELTEMLLQRDLFSQLPAADVLTRCLLVLGSSSASKPFLIRHLLTRLSGVAEQLWRVLQDGESCSVQEFPLVQHQNSFHLFRVVEALLRGSQLADRLEGPDDTGFLAHLERRVFLLSEEFPLFSMCMWVIGGLLTSARRPGSSSSGAPGSIWRSRADMRCSSRKSCVEGSGSAQRSAALQAAPVDLWGPGWSPAGLDTHVRPDLVSLNHSELLVPPWGSPRTCWAPVRFLGVAALQRHRAGAAGRSSEPQSCWSASRRRSRDRPWFTTQSRPLFLQSSWVSLAGGRAVSPASSGGGASWYLRNIWWKSLVSPSVQAPVLQQQLLDASVSLHLLQPLCPSVPSLRSDEVATSKLQPSFHGPRGSSKDAESESESGSSGSFSGLQKGR